MIEKNVLNYDVDLYSRMVRAMAMKGFSEDFIFWDKYVFKFVYHDGIMNKERKFTSKEAK